MSDSPSLARKKPKPDEAPLTPAAPPTTTTTTTTDWRDRCLALLLVLGVLTTLPRALWIGVYAGFDVFAVEALLPAIVPLRIIGYVAGAGVIVVLAQLSFLDGRPEGAAAGRLRRVALVALVLDLGWEIAAWPLLSFAGPWLESVWFRLFVFTVPPTVASLLFACWLAALLTIQRVKPMLPAVVGVGALLYVATTLVGAPPAALSAVEFVVVCATLIEVLRVRRALS